MGIARRVGRDQAGRGGRADRPQRLGQVDAAARAGGDHQADHRHRPGRGPDRLAARARSRLPSRLHGPRERLPQRLDPGPAPHRDSRALRRDRRVRRGGARDRPSRPHLLERDGDAARVRDRRVPPGRRAPPRRGLRRRRRELPAKVLRHHRGVQEPGRHDPLRLPRRPGRGAALRALDPPLGRVRRPTTGRRTRRSPATGACSPTTSIRPSATEASASGAPARPRSPAPGCSTRTASVASSSSPASRCDWRSTCARSRWSSRRDFTSRCATRPAFSSPRTPS